MEKMISDCILNLYIGAALFLTTAYAYFKTSVTPINKLYHKKLTIAVGCLVISIVFTALYPINSGIAQIIAFLYPPLFFSLFEKSEKIKTVLICFILSAFTRVLLIVPNMALSTVLVILNYPKQLFYSLFIVYVLTFVLEYLLLKIKRFRKGFQFFQNENNLGLGIIISGIVFIIFGLIYSYDFLSFSETYVVIVLIGLLITGFGLYIWIRRSITSHYRERLQQKSEERLQQMLEESEKKNQQLSETNEFLASVVHRDNHLINSLNTAIDAYIQSDDEQAKENLLREVQTLAKERTELIDKEQREAKILPSTGSALIDGSVNDLYIKAAASGIDFDLTVSQTVDAVIGKYISQTDLQTLICDHIKDAIIAVETAGVGTGRILIELSEKNGSYSVGIFDSGVEFAPETLAKLGKERVTSHGDDGGSGIGFMTTFDTMRKSHASLIITEFENKTLFSKSVSFCFDGESAFIIQSYRSELLKQTLDRDDIIVL